MCTANVLDTIPPPLLDRMEVGSAPLLGASAWHEHDQRMILLAIDGPSMQSNDICIAKMIAARAAHSHALPRVVAEVVHTCMATSQGAHA